MTIFACLSCVILVTKVLWTRRQYNVILYILNFKLCKSSGLTFLTILEKSGPLILFFKKVGKCHNFAENFMNCKILKRASSIQHCKKKNEVLHYVFFQSMWLNPQKLLIWSYLLKKPLMENFIFCAVEFVEFVYFFFNKTFAYFS